MKVTACLIVYKRQRNLPKIIESLARWEFISEIIIRDNSRLDNTINWGRYTSAMKAENDIIFTQDDDCVIDNLGEIYEKFLSEPDKLCHSGIADYEKVIPENIYGTAQMAMVGWGAFFDRRWIPVLDKYLDKYGNDDCFKRETDRIFSILLNKHHNFVLGNISHLEGKDADYALCQQPDHLNYKKLAIERALELL